MRSCKGQVIRLLNRQSLRPQTAPIGNGPPRKINQSPLEALKNEQLNFIRFDRTVLPTRADLEEASKLEVISEKGVRVPFGTLFHDKKTIVIFIRCFWCPFCQDYMYSLNTAANLDMLSSHDVNLVVVGNGSHAMIKGYRSACLNLSLLALVLTTNAIQKYSNFHSRYTLIHRLMCIRL
jgi:thiol-disulfide isomerase/thioredoxin